MASIAPPRRPSLLSSAAMGLTAAALLLAGGPKRARLSRAKHRSLQGHPRTAKRIAGLLPAMHYEGARFFGADGAPAEVVARREAGWAQLRELFEVRFAKSAKATREAAAHISDLQFTGAYRVPPPFSRKVADELMAGSFVESAAGVSVTDLDGNDHLDLGGSYGVNLFGNDLYRACIEEGAKRAAALGPVLTAYHPLVAENAARLTAMFGLDEASFHMSGTEAVMQAVRLARFHTGRKRILRFAGAYHGWWGEVQPGIGNPVPADHTLTLAEISERSLAVIAERRDLACVLVNPLQALSPNAGAASDGGLIDSGRKGGWDREAYGRWLHAVQATCRRAGVPFVMDEVFTGFRLSPTGAAGYWGLEPDLLALGKTLGGGLPVGVLLGRRELMRRFRRERPADICFARGTFNSHPYVMGAMAAFLDRLEGGQVVDMYRDLDARWDGRLERFNAALAEPDVPVRVAGMQSVWTVLYTRPSRYNWMLQFYLRAEGILLGWIGTGRLIWSLDWSDEQIDEAAARFVRAARAMEADGWWWHDGATTDRDIRRGVMREMLRARLGR